MSSVRNLIVVQRNPTSGSGRGRLEIRTLIRSLRTAGLKVRLFASRERLDRFLEPITIRDRVRCLVAAGGDGTVASLAHRHPTLPIAVLPLGTENLVARHLQVRRCGDSVARTIVQGHTRVFDTAFVNDQRFLLMASAGLDADVVRRLSARRTGNIGRSSYLLPVMTAFLKYDYPQLRVISADGDQLAEGTHVIATNIPEYGFRIPFAPTACPHDGSLDVRVFRRSGVLATLRHLIRTWCGLPDRNSDVVRFTAQEIQIKATTDTAPVQFDGDPADSCPVRIRIDPQSMTLVVPQYSFLHVKQR